MVRLSIRLLFESYINTTIVEDRKNEIFYDTKNGNQNFLLKILNKKYYKKYSIKSIRIFIVLIISPFIFRAN